MKRLTPVGAVAQSIGAKIVIVGLNAATGIITARALQPAGRGELAAMTLWPVFLASVLTLGVPSALTFQIRSHGEKRSQLVGAALFLSFCSGLIAMSFGFLLVTHWIAQYPARTIVFAEMFLFSTPMASIFLTGRAALEATGKFSASNGLLVCSPALTFICLIVLFGTHALTPYTAGIAYVVVGVIPALWMARSLWHRYRPSMGSFRDSALLLLSYGLRSYGIDLCGSMALYVDQALVVRILTPNIMGTYVVALSLSRMLNAFHNSVIMVLFPKAINQSCGVVREMTSRAMRMSTVLTAAFGLILMLLGPQLLVLFYGREYRSAGAVLRILVVEVVLSGATLVLSQAFMAVGRPGVITALQLTGLVLTVPLMIVLVPRFGLVGAGTALLLSTMARFIFVVVSFPVVLGIPIPQLFPTMGDLIYLLRTVSRQASLRGTRRTNVVEGWEW